MKEQGKRDRALMDEKSFAILSKTIMMLSGKWKIPIIVFLLQNGKVRFSDIRKGIPGISGKVLSGELHQMEGYGIIIRRPGVTGNILTEYEMTPQGQSFSDLFISILNWGNEHLK